jgi:Uma2 family endonuclease
MNAKVDFTRKYTIEEYDKIQLDEQSELIDGFIMILMSVTKMHAIATEGLYRLMSKVTGRTDYMSFREPYSVIVNEDTKIKPDFFIITDIDNAKDDGYYGVPEFIVEVLSTNRKRDLVDKYLIYEKLGVKEYWIIDPKVQTLTIYFLENGKYEEKDFLVYSDGNKEVFLLSVDNLSVRLNDLFE